MSQAEHPAHGRIPRLEAEQMAPEVARALAPRVARLGYLGEFFRVTAHQPRPLLAFMEFTEALKQALPDSLTEVVALTVASFTGNRYERNQHERLALKLGFAGEWIAEVNSMAAREGGRLSTEELAVQRLALAMLRGFGREAASALEAAVAAIGVERAVAVMLLVGRYAAHAMIVNTLELAPPVPPAVSEA